jgi:hypothetical protein
MNHTRLLDAANAVAAIPFCTLGAAEVSLQSLFCSNRIIVATVLWHCTYSVFPFKLSKFPRSYLFSLTIQDGTSKSYFKHYPQKLAVFLASTPESGDS